VHGNPLAIHAIGKRFGGVQCMGLECAAMPSARTELAAETPSVPLIAKAGYSYNFAQGRCHEKRGHRNDGEKT
jgi:hypothetical protein